MPPKNQSNKHETQNVVPAKWISIYRGDIANTLKTKTVVPDFVYISGFFFFGARRTFREAVYDAPTNFGRIIDNFEKVGKFCLVGMAVFGAGF